MGTTLALASLVSVWEYVLLLGALTGATEGATEANTRMAAGARALGSDLRRAALETLRSMLLRRGMPT